MLTPRENFIRFFNGEPYEWIPSSMDQLNFRPEFIPDFKARGRILQQNTYNGSYGGKDLFGVEWFFEESVGGSIEVAPLLDSLEDWETEIVFPDYEAMDWERCAEENRKFLNTDKIIYTTLYSSFFERLITFVGFENAAISLVDEDEKEIVHRLFAKLADSYIKYIRCLRKFFNVEMLEMHDDWGAQRGTLLSEDTHAEMILPYITKVIQAAHDEGMLVEQHSCGKIDALIPNLISSGADTWRGQASVIDKRQLVEKYGCQFKFAIEIRMDTPLTDEDAFEYVNTLIEEYKGKPIWLPMARSIPQNQKDMIYRYIRESSI